MPSGAGEQRDAAGRRADASEREALPAEEPSPASARSGGREGADKGRAMRMAEQLGERREQHRLRSKPHRAAITVAGFLLVLAGIVLSGPGVPGPGFLVILIGLALLALEFDWAERLLRRGLHYADRAGARAARTSTRRKTMIAILAGAALAAAVAAVFVFDVRVPLLND